MIPYADFVAPALFAASAMNGSIYEATNIFFRLKYDHVYESVLATPLTSGDVALGEMLYATIRGSLYSIAFLTTMAILGMTGSSWAIAMLLVGALVSFSFSAIAIAGVTFMDVIRRALGEDKISYFGFSYGSELGAAWATLFPDTVRAMVIDGAADPNADPVESNLEQLHGFESALDTFLTQCSEDEGCAFNNRGDAATAFDTLMTQLDATPIPSAPDRPPLNRAMATVAVVQAMYRQSYWPALAESLAAAQKGDGAGLLQFFDMSRRGLLGGGAALAGAGAVAALTERSTSKKIADHLSAADLEALDIPVMLSVTDASSGKVEILVGEQAIEFEDRALVAKLASATRKGAV